MLLKHPCANAAESDRMREYYKTNTCEVQVGRLRKVLADTSNCVQEGLDCQKGGRRANAAKVPMCEKTARGGYCRKRPYERGLRKQTRVKCRWEGCEKRRLIQATMCRKTVKKAGEERMLPKAAVCEKTAKTSACEVKVGRLQKQSLVQATVCRKTVKGREKSECCRSTRVRENCRRRMLSRVTVCTSKTESESCQGQLCAMR